MTTRPEHDAPEAVELLDPSGDVIGRRPLSLADQLAALEALSEGGDPELAELLDHLCHQLDHVVTFVDALAPALLGLTELGEQLASGGPMALLGMLSGPAEG